MRFCDKEHENSTYIESDKAFYTYPPHMDDIPRMPERDDIYDELKNRPDVSTIKESNFEEYWKATVTTPLYKKFAEKYSKKMWMVDDNKVLDGEEFSNKRLSYDGEDGTFVRK